MDGFNASGMYTLSIQPCSDVPVAAERCDVIGDEDANGLADCADPACFFDLICLFGPDPSACDPLALEVITDFGSYQGSTLGAPSVDRGSCAGGGSERVYQLRAPHQISSASLRTLPA